MSPEPVASRAGRVLRGRVASDASALTFPTIETVGPLPVTAPAPARAAHVDPADADRARLEAAARGYADGLAAGRDEALVEVRARAVGVLAQMEAVLDELRARQARTFDELTGDVASFAYAVVEAMLGHELSVCRDPLRGAVARALRLAPDGFDAVVLVHPEDAELLGPIDGLNRARGVAIATDDAVERGSCVVRAGDCEIDAQIDGALARLREVLS
jgi:flagellar biosynthesis/type III secretory pathway protein FliH